MTPLPYKIPKQSVTQLAVVTLDFSANCLETLEEIALRGKEQFLSIGGKILKYTIR